MGSRWFFSAIIAAITLSPVFFAETPERLYAEAARNFSEQRYGLSERLLREAITQRPRWFEARFLLGASLVSLGRAADAIEQLEAAHRLNPDHLDCAKLLAAGYLGRERPGEAMRLLAPLLKRRSPDEELLLLAIESLHVRNDAGDAEEALRLSARGLTRFPRSVRMLAWRGYALREKGSLAEARKSLKAALTLEPGDITSATLLADVLRREGLYIEALQLFDQVLRDTPADEEAIVGKGRTLTAMGQAAQALEVLRTAVEAAPEAARLRLELSNVYAKLGERYLAAREAAEFRRLRGAMSTIPAGLRATSVQ